MNGRRRRIAGDPGTPLLWILRDQLGLKGTKYGCGTGVCGACTVHLDGKPIRSCVVPLKDVEEKSVTTIEGLAAASPHRLLDAWIDEQVPQCGYCQPGMIMTAAPLLSGNATPTDAEITAALNGVLCRCGTYQRVRKAIHRAAAGSTREHPELAHPRASLRPDEASAAKTVFQPSPWVRIDADGVVTVLIDRTEMGQGVVTSLATLVAEELEVDLAQVRTEFAPAATVYANPFFGVQVTGGSTSVSGSWGQLRKAGAVAREMLIAAAAATWGVPAGECRAEHGTVVHRASNRRLDYGSLSARAATLKPPRRVALKEPGSFRLIGHSQPRLEIPAHVAGATVFGTDLALPDMLVAVVKRPPRFEAAVKGIDAARAKAVRGVRDIFRIEGGVAIVADDAWAAFQAHDLLDVSWTGPTGKALDQGMIRAQFQAAARRKGRVELERGDVDAALKRAHTLLEVEYEMPFLAHAALEPVNCTAYVHSGGCDVWVPTQAQTATQEEAARATGLPKKAVRVHTTFVGGGFGRKLDTDFVGQAVAISKRLRRPVQLLWSREDDVRHDRYRPAHYARMRGGLDADGGLIGWHQRLVGPPLALDCIDVPYEIRNFRDERIQKESRVPTGAWRSVGAGQNAFVIESFVDELAHAAGADPLLFRLGLLKRAPRHRGVLELAAEKAGWAKPLADDRYRGVAVYFSFGSWVAEIAEISIDESGAVRAHRVVCAVDCGIAVNPDTVAAQVEGAVAFGLTAALKSAVTVEGGGVLESGFRDYPLLAYSEMPEVEVHIVKSAEAPGGIGEPGVPPIAPAVGNAVFAATGRRIRRLPIRADDLR
ncbi:MAG TPA: molybdopterin-dependent oxidoreductase [Stellaceae bacterium]|nr:molybdopterin-dependent oxidoreductase [Stellaceae bacterium]